MPVKRGKTCSLAEFKALWNNYSLTLADIGERLGISGAAVQYRGKARMLAPRPMYPRTKVIVINDPAFAEMYLAGVSPSEMAQHYKVSNARIGRTAKRLGITRQKVSRFHVITIAQFRERAILLRLAQTAAAEQACIVAAEMWDRNDRNNTGGRKLGGAA